jgi:triacylglycerol lipase
MVGGVRNGWLMVGVCALFALAVAGAVWLWRRTRPVPRRKALVPLVPRHPVILAHGLMGFDVIKLGKREAEYFRGVPAKLRRMGAQVHLPRVPAVASIQRRAETLAEHIRGVDARRVNIIGHSLGGLDARYAIAKLGLANKVACLVTIGTPHRGTPIADVGAAVVGDRLGLRRALEVLRVDVDAFYDITTARMSAFNADVADARGVAYASFPSSVRARLRRLNPLLLAPYLYLSEQHGPNDGLVPISSQKWGEVWGEIDADHWAQIGWSGRFDAPAFYAQVLRELRAHGF